MINEQTKCAIVTKIYHFSTTVQPCCSVTTEFFILSDFEIKLTASFQIKISAAQLNF